MFTELWIEERFQDIYKMEYRIDKTLFSGESSFQKVDVVQTRGHGKMLLNDGLVMVSEKDEFVYHDMITHVPLFVHPDPKKVRIIGGGDGTCLREVLKHSALEQAMLVDLDGQLVDICKTYLREMSQDSLNDDRAIVRVGDGSEFVRHTDMSFDAIIVDSTDPLGPSEPLFSKEFYLACKKVLREGGILIAQAGNLMYQDDFGRQIGEDFASLFAMSGYYQAAVPSYIGGLHAFAWGSDKTDLAKPALREAGFSTRYYSPNSRRAAFLLPV